MRASWADWAEARRGGKKSNAGKMRRKRKRPRGRSGLRPRRGREGENGLNIFEKFDLVQIQIFEFKLEDSNTEKTPNKGKKKINHLSMNFLFFKLKNSIS